MTSINPKISRLVSELQCLGDADLPIKKQIEIYSAEPELLHSRIEKVRDKYVCAQPEGRAPIVLPKSLRSYCIHQMNGLCNHRKDCHYAHTVALWFFANNRHFKGLFKTQPCLNQDDCSFQATNSCNRIHKNDLQYRPIKVFMISVSPPSSPREAKEAHVEEVPMNSFSVLADLNNDDEALIVSDSPPRSHHSSKESTPMTHSSIAWSIHAPDELLSSDDEVDCTPTRATPYLFLDRTFSGMPPLEFVDSPNFVPKNKELLSLLSPSLTQVSRTPVFIPPLDLSDMKSPEVSPRLLEQTFGDFISCPSTPGSEQTNEVITSRPPLRIVSPPP